MFKTKIIALMLVLILLAACGSAASPADDRTIDDFFQAFETSFELGDVFGDGEPTIDIPFYGMIGAIDGIMFYINGMPVSIYMYEDVATLEQVKDDVAMLSDWPSNGRFLLESRDTYVIAFFEGV